MSAPQYCNRANIPRRGHGRRQILIDSHPYSHETSIFTLGAPHGIWTNRTMDISYHGTSCLELNETARITRKDNSYHSPRQECNSNARTPHTVSFVIVAPCAQSSDFDLIIVNEF